MARRAADAHVDDPLHQAHVERFGLHPLETRRELLPHRRIVSVAVADLDRELDGDHVLHYMWGILILVIVGAVALRGDEKTRCHPLAGISYGIGVALIVDEFALLLDLRDVYWAKQGRTSVDIAVGVIAIGGTLLASIPIFQRLRKNRGH